MRFRSALKVDGFTILSSNCIGGVLYNMLGMKILSPTVNMFITGDNFVKLVSNPVKYLVEEEPFPINDFYKNGDKVYPLIGVDDIVLNCLHYKNCEEAIEAWNRRRVRVDLDKIVVIATSWDLENQENVDAILESKYPSVVFTENCIYRENCIYYDPKYWESSGMPALTDYRRHGWSRYFEYYFDVVEWLNSNL